MRINQKPCGDSRIIKTLIDQVSALQEDVGTLQDNVTSLDTAKANKVDLADKVETAELDASKATIGNATIPTLNFGEAGGAEGATLKVTNAITTYVQGTSGKINTLESTVAAIGTGTINNVLAQHITPETDGTLDITATNVNVANNVDVENDLTATGITSQQDVTNNLFVNNVADIKTLKADTATVTDIEIDGGTITGVTIEADKLQIKDKDGKSTMADIDHIKTGAITMSDVNELRPSGTLTDTNDRYTIELPVFTGTFYLVWKNNNNVVWSAVVTGSGCDYSISWNVLDKDAITVTNFFQYENKAYIRTSANGVLYYMYTATEELEAPWIYFNMQGWEKGDLEDLCDENHQFNAETAIVYEGTITFGNFYAPGLNSEQELMDNLEVKNLKVTVSEEIVPATINWNEKEVKVCDSFTTDWVL